MHRRRPVRPATTPETRPFRYDVSGRVGVALKLAATGREVLGTADKLNLHGMHAHFGRWLPPESPCMVRLELIDADLAVDAAGWVVYSEGGHTAVQFRPFPPDTADVLARYLHPPRMD
ncbi:MAG: hypothetical protein OEY97_03395 [Nitrospirota bacterium]|nr:hypothetical protein [Nitrospirota bacterium]